jgi:hypothetical protein
MEIAVYRKLVESEEDRLGIDNTDNSESQGGCIELSSISWLTNSDLVYEPKCVGMGGGSCGVSDNEYNCTQEPNHGRRNYKDTKA